MNGRDERDATPDREPETEDETWLREQSRLIDLEEGFSL
jgi:hypothetical protein